jgi:hypothetical protein
MLEQSVNAWNFIDVTKLEIQLSEIVAHSNYPGFHLDTVSFSHINSQGHAVFNCTGKDATAGMDFDSRVFLKFRENGDFVAFF